MTNAADPYRVVVPLTYGPADGDVAPGRTRARRWWPAALAAAPAIVLPLWMGPADGWLPAALLPAVLLGCPAVNLAGVVLGSLRLARRGDRVAGAVIVLLNLGAIGGLVAFVLANLPAC